MVNWKNSEGDYQKWQELLNRILHQQSKAGEEKRPRPTIREPLLFHCSLGRGTSLPFCIKGFACSPFFLRVGDRSMLTWFIIHHPKRTEYFIENFRKGIGYSSRSFKDFVD